MDNKCLMVMSHILHNIQCKYEFNIETYIDT